MLAGLLLAASAGGALAQAATETSATPPVVRRLDSGLEVRTAQGVMTLEPWSDRIIHVRFATAAGWSNPYNSWVVGQPVKTAWRMGETADAWTLQTDALQVSIAKADGALSFLNSAGQTILAEGLNPRQTPASGEGAVEQAFKTVTPVYGLGQHQTGMLDAWGSSVHLQQANRDVAIPMLVSPKGFGILWNNASVTDVEVGRDTARAPLIFHSEAGQGVDYDFIYGPNLDAVVGGYRQLTGDAPLMPRWMWGLWQSREHYTTQQEVLGVGARYRALGAPLDAVVQDWQYWPKDQWGSHRFDLSRYPDPKAMVAGLHRDHLHVAISVWPRFDLDTENLAELDRIHAAYPTVFRNVYPSGVGRWYDAYSAPGRALYWDQIQRNLGVLGFDAWWLDASEAELGGEWGQMRDLTTAAGPGRDVYNAYPLMHTTGVYQGALQDHPDKRPVILTRSAFAGQQRNAAITWSGDTTGDWRTFRRQIPAALNFSLSGIPYWSADIGGFFGGDPKDPAYAELFTRWYEFAVFNPMFRVHGTGADKALWNFAPATQKTLLDYDRLRYRLLPYIYALSWDVTHNRGTMMRALAMDFQGDDKALEVGDQYMFGRALLVSPVVQPGAQTRTVYLPAGQDWYDFWTGQRLAGGQTLAVAADVSRIPVHVRAGSILPLGPVKPYADAPSDEPLELRVYPGRDGGFTLYDDAGDGSGYRRGEYAEIPLRWDDARQALQIGTQIGRYPGMPAGRRMRLVCGPAPTGRAVDVTYTGRAVQLHLACPP
jgi:alpha-D-xyloside xylohydrolase